MIAMRYGYILLCSRSDTARWRMGRTAIDWRLFDPHGFCVVSHA